MSFTNRCAICNCVNLEEIATELGDYHQTAFTEDPANPLFYICVECDEEINGILTEWEMEDE